MKGVTKSLTQSGVFFLAAMDRNQAGVLPAYALLENQ